MSKLLFFDLETTGVKFWRNGIHQIGGIVYLLWRYDPSRQQQDDT